MGSVLIPRCSYEKQFFLLSVIIRLIRYRLNIENFCAGFFQKSTELSLLKIRIDSLKQGKFFFVAPVSSSSKFLFKLTTCLKVLVLH